MRAVMKFGASTLTDGKGIAHVASIVKESVDKGDQIIVVTSALGGVPEDVMVTAEAASKGNGQAVAKLVQKLKRKVRAYATKAIKKPAVRKSIAWEALESCNKLESLLYSVYHTGDLTDRTRDRMLFWAENISSSLVSGALESLGVVTTPLTAYDAGIVTDSSYGRARPVRERVKVGVKKAILPLIKQKVTPVVAGNAAADTEGNPTTLGNGGSDYCASLIGAALPSKEIWIWIGVDGVMTADPKIVRNVKTIPVLSYSEAAELAFSGLKILHPRTIEPAMERDIPVIVRNAFNLKNPGTRIVKTPERYEGMIKSVSIIKDVAMVAVEGTSMIGAPGTAARVFGTLGKSGINILMISQSSSETNISLLIQSQDLTKALATLNAEFRDEVVRRFFVQDHVCAIAVIGAGMRGTPGIASRVFNAVASRGINVLMAAQGSSELNISFVVDEADGDEAVRAIHEDFELSKLGS